MACSGERARVETARVVLRPPGGSIWLKCLLAPAEACYFLFSSLPEPGSRTCEIGRGSKNRRGCRGGARGRSRDRGRLLAAGEGCATEPRLASPEQTLLGQPESSLHAPQLCRALLVRISGGKSENPNSRPKQCPARAHDFSLECRRGCASHLMWRHNRVKRARVVCCEVIMSSCDQFGNTRPGASANIVITQKR